MPVLPRSYSHNQNYLSLIKTFLLDVMWWTVDPRRFTLDIIILAFILGRYRIFGRCCLRPQHQVLQFYAFGRLNRCDNMYSCHSLFSYKRILDHNDRSPAWPKILKRLIFHLIFWVRHLSCNTRVPHIPQSNGTIIHNTDILHVIVWHSPIIYCILRICILWTSWRVFFPFLLTILDCLFYFWVLSHFSFLQERLQSEQ